MLPPLKWSFGLLLVLVAYSAPACAPNAGQYTDLETRLIEPLERKSLLLQVDYGDVQLLASEDRQKHAPKVDEGESEIDATIKLLEALRKTKS